MVEVMVAATISGVVLAGVLTTFVFFCKTGVRMSHYTDMESGARDTLSLFSQDARQAENAVWVSASSLRLTVSDVDITYAYNAGAKTFTRTVAGSTSVLVTHITAFQFTAYSVDMAALDVQANLSAAGLATKMVQLDMDLSRSSRSSGTATSQVLSARYVLRNKKVS